jgi:PKHD-type hydroxylase
MLTIPNLLTRDQVQQCRDALEGATWRDGRGSAGHLAVQVKHNQQLAPDDPLSMRLGDFILERLGASERFMAAAVPLKVLPPRFNRHAGGGAYGDHVDSAIFTVAGTPHRIRGDLSATLFLSDAETYDGGELIIAGTCGEHRVKLPAGHLIVYPASTVHRVTPVTRGARLAAFFWIQSLVREDTRRAMLLELDDAICALRRDHPQHPAIVRLTGLYHNLLRHWADT